MTIQTWDGSVHYDGSGTVTYDDALGTVRVDCGGTGDFWGTSDTGSMVYRSWVTGERPIAKLLSSVGPGATNARIAMLRSSAAANAAMVAFLTNGSNGGLSIVWRDTPGAVAGYTGEGGPPYNNAIPVWARFTYDGSTVTVEFSQDNGASWTLVGSRTIPTPLTLFGLVSGGGGTPQAMTFDNHGLTGATPSIVWRMQDVPGNPYRKRRSRQRVSSKIDRKVMFADDGKLRVIRDGR